VPDYPFACKQVILGGVTSAGVPWKEIADRSAARERLRPFFCGGPGALRGQMAPGARHKFGAPMFEPEVFRKQMYCIEGSACDIV